MSAKGAERSVQLDVQILGREFKVACKEHERAELQEAVTLLDTRMREIKDGGKITGVDRIAVMAALNIANELLRARRAPPMPPPAPLSTGAAVDETALQRRIQSMHTAVDQALGEQEKLF